MAQEFGSSDFLDSDFQAAQRRPFSSVSSFAQGGGGGGAPRSPTREELEAKVHETHQRLAELKRAQEELERQRASLEEARRRQVEYQTGREEMVQHLTRGIGLIEQAEFKARQDAEQMSKTLSGLRAALQQIQSIHHESWNQESRAAELTKALTTIENARMEWNSAQLKWPLLSPTASDSPAASPGTALLPGAAPGSFLEWCKLGLALTWPIALVVLAAFIALIVLLINRTV